MLVVNITPRLPPPLFELSRILGVLWSRSVRLRKRETGNRMLDRGVRGLAEEFCQLQDAVNDSAGC